MEDGCIGINGIYKGCNIKTNNEYSRIERSFQCAVNEFIVQAPNDLDNVFPFKFLFRTSMSKICYGNLYQTIFQ